MIRAPSSGWLRMTTHSAAVERALLQEHRVGDADLADVVQQRRLVDDVELVRPTRPSSRAITVAEARDAPRMAGRVGVPRVDRRRQRLEGGRRALDHRAMGFSERGVLLADRLARLLQAAAPRAA